MGSTRGVHFDFQDGDIYFDFDFGTYTLMLYYAKQLNYEKAKLLYDATLSERYYRASYNIPLDGLADEDSSHFNTNEISQVIDFIENELIPELKNEEQDLIDKYGGRDGFHDKFNKDKGFLGMIIYDDEYYQSEPLNIAAVLNAIKSILSHAISIGQAYNVGIY
jgi:hypothetical protein